MGSTTFAVGATSASSQPLELTETQERSRFFFWMSVLFLSIVLIGFAPTLYLRPFFDNQIPLLVRDVLHGVIHTAWFVWLVSQTALIRTGHTAMHRRLGLFGVCIAAAVVISGPMAAFTFAARPAMIGLSYDVNIDDIPDFPLPWEGTLAEIVSSTVWPSLFLTALFGGLVIAAVVLRGNPAAHKRLMLLASISIIGPAFARIFNWPLMPGEGSPLKFAAHLSLAAAILAYDYFSDRRIHPATMVGCAGLVLLMLVVSPIIADSDFGMTMIRMLDSSSGTSVD